MVKNVQNVVRYPLQEKSITFLLFYLTYGTTRCPIPLGGIQGHWLTCITTTHLFVFFTLLVLSLAPSLFAKKRSRICGGRSRADSLLYLYLNLPFLFATSGRVLVTMMRAHFFLFLTVALCIQFHYTLSQSSRFYECRDDNDCPRYARCVDDRGDYFNNGVPGDYGRCRCDPGYYPYYGDTELTLDLDRLDDREISCRSRGISTPTRPTRLA